MLFVKLTLDEVSCISERNIIPQSSAFADRQHLCVSRQADDITITQKFQSKFWSEKQPTLPFVPTYEISFFSETKKKLNFPYLSFTGLVSPSKQLLAKQLLETNTNTLDFPALSMDAALDNLSPQPPASRLQQQQNPMASIPPRSAKITMEEAAESAVTLAGPDQSRMPGANSRMPNGRPPAIQTGTT